MIFYQEKNNLFPSGIRNSDKAGKGKSPLGNKSVSSFKKTHDILCIIIGNIPKIAV